MSVQMEVQVWNYFLMVNVSASGTWLGRIFQVWGDWNIMCDTGQQSEIGDKYKITTGTDISWYPALKAPGYGEWIQAQGTAQHSFEMYDFNNIFVGLNLIYREWR